MFIDFDQFGNWKFKESNNFENKCDICDIEVHVGEPIYWLKNTSHVMHEACYNRQVELERRLHETLRKALTDPQTVEDGILDCVPYITQIYDIILLEFIRNESWEKGAKFLEKYLDRLQLEGIEAEDPIVYLMLGFCKKNAER